MAPAADVLRYLLSRPRLPLIVRARPDLRAALKRLRDYTLTCSCQSVCATLFTLGAMWEEAASAVRDDLDTDPDRSTMGFSGPDPLIARVLLGDTVEVADPLVLLDD